MKYFVIPVILLSLITYSVNLVAQQDRRDKIESLKIAFITNKLDLTPKEAQVFWPVYNEYTDKLEAMRKERRNQYLNVKDKLDSMSDKDVEALVDGEMVFRQNELDLQKEYHQKLKQVLPIKKVAKLYVAEESFKRELLRRIQENRK